MSRSRKKPYVSIACIGRGSMGKWKNDCNRIVRRIPIEEDMSPIKKVTNRFSAPDDGRHYWNNPKATRK